MLVRTNRNAALVRDALDERRHPGGDQRRGQRVRHRARARLAARCWRRSSGRPRPPRAALGRADAVPRLERGAGRRAPTRTTGRSVHRRLHRWARVLRGAGVASLTETIDAGRGPARAGARARDGERAADRPAPRRPAAARRGDGRAARHHRADRVAARSGSPRPAEDTSDEERSRRLESDAEAVQVLTIHRSKGLEFPIVYCPYLWEPGWIPSDAQPVVFHDPDAGDERDDRRRRSRARTPAPPRASTMAEQRGEDLRLAYVALTRATHQAVVWWAGVVGQPQLGARPAAVRPRRGRQRRRRRARRRRPTRRRPRASRRSRARRPGCISVERGDAGLPAAWAGRAADRAELSAARFDRGLDRALAAHLLQRHHRRRARGARGERARGDRRRRRRAAATAPAAAGADEDEPRCCARAVAAGGHAGRRRTSARSCTASSRRPTSPRPTSTPSSPRSVARGAGAPARSRSATRRRVVAGLRAAIETPLGPLLGGLRAARRRARRPARRARLRAAARRRRRARPAG